jgi:hypothetical protein
VETPLTHLFAVVSGHPKIQLCFHVFEGTVTDPHQQLFATLLGQVKLKSQYHCEVHVADQFHPLVQLKFIVVHAFLVVQEK